VKFSTWGNLCRCYAFGVYKSQRKGKIYSCKNCGLEIDADINAALNHQQDLPDIPYDLRRLNLNRVGFFWKTTGFYSLTGEEITVSLPKKSA
jgi:predicted nucleic acid-binding Zn ribbon protein